jgi:hypothetical protein
MELEYRGPEGWKSWQGVDLVWSWGLAWPEVWGSWWCMDPMWLKGWGSWQGMDLAQGWDPT